MESNDDEEPLPAVAVTQSPIAEESNNRKKKSQEGKQQSLSKIPPETDKSLVEYLWEVAQHPNSELAQKPFQDFCDETPTVFGPRNSIERKKVRNRREYLRRIPPEKFDALVLKILGQQPPPPPPPAVAAPPPPGDDEEDDMSQRSTPPPPAAKKTKTANKKKKNPGSKQKEKKEQMNNKPNKKYPPMYQLQIATDEIFSTLDASNTAIKVVYKKLQHKFGCNKGLDRSQKDAVKVRLQHLIDCRDDDDADSNKPDTPWPDEKILQVTDEMFHATKLSNSTDDGEEEDTAVPSIPQFLHRLHESYHFFMTESVKTMIQDRLHELLRSTQNDHRTVALPSTSTSALANAKDDNKSRSDSGDPSADMPDDDKQDVEEDGNGGTTAIPDGIDGGDEEESKKPNATSQRVEKKRKSTGSGENGGERPVKKQTTSSSNNANHDDDDDKLIDQLITNLQANLQRDKKKREKSLKTAKEHVQVAKKAYEDCLAVVQQLEKDEEHHFQRAESILSNMIETRRRGR